MAMVVVAYRRTHSPSHVAWSEGRQPLVRCAAFIKWTKWTLAMTFSGHDDCTINIVLGLLLFLLLLFLLKTLVALLTASLNIQNMIKFLKFSKGGKNSIPDKLN